MKRAGLVAAILGCLALALWFSTRFEPAKEAPREPLWTSRNERPQELFALDSAVDSAQRVSVAAGAEPPPTAKAPAESDAARLRVVVLARSTHMPRAGAEVEIDFAGSSGERTTLQGKTDLRGAVEWTLAARESWPKSCRARVRDVDGEQSFAGLPWQAELVLLVEDCTRLRGRVVTRVAAPLGWELSPVEVRVDLPVRGAMSVPVMLGRASADGEGRFELQVCPAVAPEQVDVTVDMPSFSTTRRVDWALMSSVEGAEIAIDLHELRVRVVDETGAPLEGVELRVSAIRTPPSANGAFPTLGTSDARGEWSAAVEAGFCEIVAGLDGFADANTRVEVTSASEIVRLSMRRLDAEDRLRGRVVLEDGTPVAAALVTAAPALESREAAVAAIAQIRSDAQGRFELAIAGGRDLSIQAYRRDLGMSDELVFKPDGRELELVIRPQGSLEVRLTPPQGLAGFAGGLVEYVLVDRRHARSLRGHDFQVPFEIDEVPAGEYNLYVHVAAWDAWTQAGVHVEPRQATQVELSSHVARFARGRVLRADGSAAFGSRIELQHPEWPDEVERVFAAITGADGAFELLLGEETACSAWLSPTAAPAHRVALHAGDDNLLRVD